MKLSDRLRGVEPCRDLIALRLEAAERIETLERIMLETADEIVRELDGLAIGMAANSLARNTVSAAAPSVTPNSS